MGNQEEKELNNTYPEVVDVYITMDNGDELRVFKKAEPVQMENQIQKETSLYYFFRITKNNAINLGRLIEAYIPAKKIYDMEIEEAKKEGWRSGYNDAVKFYNQFENK